jgi:hypothetical protein
MENSNNDTYIAEIISKIWPAGVPSQSSSYFAIIVVSLLLDPKYGTDMKDKSSKYVLLFFYIGLYLIN